MKEVHLICNAHLDPIWQWEWEEGAAAALSTFRSAADLADEFDYIFCHNEVTLYKYIEQYAPALFERIKELIRIGKWRIIGGWYLQPDVNMPQGESIVRQILVGRKYFMEKFGQWSRTAINFDSFGHSRGMVQIMTKCGQENYIHCRPGDDPIPCEQYLWKGFDGSTVKVDSFKDMYSTPLGHAAAAIKGKIDARPDDDIICILWGVGNHGGGPSRKDLADIKEMIEEGSMKILHSYPDQFFARIDPKAVHDKSLRVVMPGCYTSMSRIKSMHAELENTLYMVEKLCSMAALRGLIEYPQKELDEVVEDLLNAEFHDVLPGSSVRAGEENGLRLLNHGLMVLNRLRARAYFALTGLEEKAAEGEYPVLVLNTNPYEWETDVVCELSTADINFPEDVISLPRVLDQNGNEVPCQLVKEESNLSVDWRKRIWFRAKLNPMSLNRYSIYMESKPRAEKAYMNEGNIVVDLPAIGKYVEIDRATGLMKSYKIDGKEYIDQKSAGAFCPVFFKDNEDAWASADFQLPAVGSDPVNFKLMEKCYGPFAGMEPIRIIEDGDIYLGVECFFECENTAVRVEYDIFKDSPDVDIKVDAFMNDVNRMLRVSVPVNVDGTYIGQTMFGTEELYMNGKECVAQRFVSMREAGAEKQLSLFNRGTYGSMFRDGAINLSLVRTPVYCALPIFDRPLIPTDRFIKRIDLGERNFIFRMTVAPEKELERLSAEFNMPPYACNVFPVESGVDAAEFTMNISDKNITLVAMKKSEEREGYVLRLLNNDSEGKSAVLTCCGAEIKLDFGKYEVKTVIFNDGKLTEIRELAI